MQPKADKSLDSLPTTMGAIYYPYENPTPGHIPIMGVGVQQGFSYFSKKDLNLMKDCGINIAENTLSLSNDVKCTPVGQINPGYCDTFPMGTKFPNIYLSLKNASSCDMKIMVRIENPIPPTNLAEVDPHTNLPVGQESKWASWINNWEKVITAYGGNSVVAGWMLQDEPTMSCFWGLAAAKVAIDNIATTHRLVYVNLLQAQWGGATKLYFTSDNDWTNPPEVTFEDYVEKFNNLFKPSLLSYDSYPFKYKDGEVVTRPEYYISLSKYSAYSKLYNIPFWAYVPSNGVSNRDPFTEGYVPSVCEPTLGRLRFSAFVAIAYGAKGLVYWRFFQDTPGVESHVGSPINLIGDKTPTYDMVKTVNNQIRQKENIFLNAEHVSVKFTKWPSTYPYYEQLGIEVMDGTYGSIKSISTGDAGCIVALFREREGSSITEYTVVVNLDSEAKQTVNIGFVSYVTDMDVSNDFGSGLISPGLPTPITSFRGSLEAGNWKIFKRSFYVLPNNDSEE